MIKERGDIYIVDKSVNIGGNVTGSNVNTGDNVNQSIGLDSKANDLFSELIKHINQHAEKSQQEQLIYFVEELKSALTEKNKEKTGKMFGFLRKALGDVGSLVSIASFFGVTLPII